MKKLRLLIIEPEMCEFGKKYLMVATMRRPDDYNAVITRPGILQFVDTETGEITDVEYADVMESQPTGDVRELPIEIQIPLYPEAARGPEARGSESGSGDSRDSGEVRKGRDKGTAH